MRKGREGNFAGRILDRLGENSALIEAASGQALRGNEIAGRITGFAAGFLSNGLRPRDRMLISCALSPPSTLAYLGALYAGIVPVLVDERTLTTSGSKVFAKAHAKAAWTGGRVPWDWAKKNGFLHLEGDFDSPPPDSLPPAPCSENDLAALMHTSGSTGVPRLVMVTHGNLIANTEAIIRSQQIGADETAMLIMPASYCFGASILHTHLYQGGGVVFDSRFMFPDKVLQAINTYSCTTFAGVPTVYSILLRRSNLRSIPLPTLRRFLQAGGALHPESVRELREIVPGANFLVMYGQTEATARISCLPAARLGDKSGSAGLPLDNLTVRVVDGQGKELPHGHTGEIQVRGPSICAGYLDEPEATQQKFGEGWLKTGDLGSLDADGYLWIKGRSSDFIKIRGYRVSLAEVEAKVAAVPGVGECAAIGVQHPEAGEAIALFVVGESGEPNGGAPEKALAKEVQRALPAQWTCASVKILAELPKTPNGKIARSELQTIA
ncbi:MAG TPA: class I adenylate-forming enzyme family protein [Terriglobales bacterium]|nr:class I adenylate-forming enzyme family protein [Terriglobales bacterium]